MGGYPLNEKTCYTCERTLDINYFQLNQRNCRVCRSESDQRRRYNLTAVEYAALMRVKVCGICADDIPQPCVDHDHETNLVRGLLCQPCNTGLGNFKDSAAIIRKAVLYLANHESKKLNQPSQTNDTTD